MDIPLALSNVLNLLLVHEHINESQLAKKINIPRTTLRRLVYGQTPDPRASTLNLLADYFDISMDELLGKKPLTIRNKQNDELHSNKHVPLIKWIDLLNWQDSQKYHDSEDSITLDAAIAEAEFAVRNRTDAMLPHFQTDCLLVIAPNSTPINRNYVVAYIDEIDEVVFRQFFSEGKFQFLKPINEQFPTFKFGSKDKILGKVLQVRNNLT